MASEPKAYVLLAEAAHIAAVLDVFEVSVRTEILFLDAIAIKIHSYLFICSKNAFS